LATAFPLRARETSATNGRFTNGAARGAASTRNLSMAQGLGWASVGLGLAEVLAPRSIARLVGADESEANLRLVRAMGARELLAGAGIFSQRQEAGWLWGRVAGDLLDLALLAAVLKGNREGRKKAAAAMVAIAGIAALDALVARSRMRDRHRAASARVGDDAPFTSDEAAGATLVRKVITINLPLEDVTRRWEEAERRLPNGECLAAAAITFDPAPREGQTEVRATLTYEKGNRLVALAKTFRQETPALLLQHQLRHMKQLLEIGEIVHSDASIHRGMHAAQPEAEARV
jgi:hypothetical protein